MPPSAGLGPALPVPGARRSGQGSRDVLGQWEASEKSGLVLLHTCSLGATVYLLCPRVRPCKVGGHYGLQLKVASSTGPHWLDSPSN